MAIDRRHPLHSPARGRLPDDRVERLTLGPPPGNHVRRPPAELVGIGILATLIGLIERHQRLVAGLGRTHVTRVMYAPVLVSTLMRSPSFTNSGTCTILPVSTLAGLVPAEERSPFTPGSDSTTRSSTLVGRSIPTRRPS